MNFTLSRCGDDCKVSGCRDLVRGGAWLFLVGGIPCQVNSGNERDAFHF